MGIQRVGRVAKGRRSASPVRVKLNPALCRVWLLCRLASPVRSGCALAWAETDRRLPTPRCCHGCGQLSQRAGRSLGYTRRARPPSPFWRAHARTRAVAVGQPAKPLAPDSDPYPGAGRPGRLGGPGLQFRVAALALAGTEHHPRRLAAAVSADRLAPARALAGHRGGVRGTARLRPDHPQRAAVLLGWLDQPLRLLLPGAADHRRGDLALDVHHYLDRKSVV